MFGIDNSGSALDTVAHIIQVALTPVFLLSGIATLLNVFSARLARVADRVDAVAKALDGADPAQARILSARLAHLHRRSLALDVAVVLGAIGGAATCGAVLTLFVGALRERTGAAVLFALFGFAVLCALGAIVAFTVEMLMASTGIRDEAAEGRRAAEQDAPEAAEPENQAGASEPAASGDGA
jgi:membrane associated rhomboid family serine protease